MSAHAHANVPPAGSLIAGKYRVEKILGQGGMGVVVAVTHVQLQEPRAIKLMFKEDLGDKSAVERFEREARAAVKLKSSEHITQVLDVDRLPNDQPYMVMELLQGQDLDKRLKDRGVFPIHEACSYVVQACKALAEAHKIGIIHRDLKPQNLFLTRRNDGTPCIKLLDFGISKHVICGNTPVADLTKPQDVLGSSSYMSPEQSVSSRDVVPQSDIWSLGVVLYKLLTGRVPFPGQSRMETLLALLDDNKQAPAPSLYRPDIPRDLEAVILKCLEKPINKRYSSAIELMVALAPFTVPGQTSADDEISDVATTLPLNRPKLVANPLGGTVPMMQGLSRHSIPSIDDDPDAAYKTLPLDPKTVQASLHDYLPPRAMRRPAPPPQEEVTKLDGPTPRMPARELVGTIYRRPIEEEEETTREVAPPAPDQNVKSPLERRNASKRPPPMLLVAACLLGAILVLLAAQLR